MNRRDFLKSALAITALGGAARLAAQAGVQGKTPGEEKQDPKKVTRRRYKNTDLTLPLLGFGMMRLPRNSRGIDEKKAQEMVDMAMETISTPHGRIMGDRAKFSSGKR